jgi:hypothetical protein
VQLNELLQLMALETQAVVTAKAIVQQGSNRGCHWIKQNHNQPHQWCEVARNAQL